MTRKKIQLVSEDRPAEAGDEATGKLVMVQVNPKLAPMGRMQFKANGQVFVAGEPAEVSSDEWDALKDLKSKGVQALVRV